MVYDTQVLYSKTTDYYISLRFVCFSIFYVNTWKQMFKINVFVNLSNLSILYGLLKVHRLNETADKLLLKFYDSNV